MKQEIAEAADEQLATVSEIQGKGFGVAEGSAVSAPLTVKFTFMRSATPGKIDVLTMGARDLDFKATCDGTREVNRTYSVATVSRWGPAAHPRQPFPKRERCPAASR
jgi:hypothetical protein